MAADAYAYVTTLTRDQWAWEFLRRNPEYQSDYAHLITIWRALESDYGAPPYRDFARWKQDPRAYGPLNDSEFDALNSATGDLCIGEDERVLIECWMGAKWGFHKFPLDPACPTPPSPSELSWRQPPAPEPRLTDDAYRLDIPFDLSLPLPPQLEAAKFRLVSRASELRRTGLSAPFSVANQCVRWTQMLRLLDAKAAEGSGTEVEAGLLREAHAMVHGGYRDIVRLVNASAG
ncbi:MAG: transcriptional regulator domain-containing protein [Thiobacillus sp.]